MAMIMEQPNIKPNNPNFSCGPCSKYPGYSLDALSGGLFGRSHRSAPGKAKLKEVIETQREILGIPADYKIGIVPASDTGAMEMAMWSMLGERGVDVLAWENFSNDWLVDITKQLKLDDVRVFEAEYGEIPDLDQVDTDRDVVFPWNGTTSGAKVPNGDWIAQDRKGLTIADSTSAVFACDIPWGKLDVVTWSWQKVLGGEAAHGMLVLSPRAVARLESFTPDRALPKIFRMTKKGKLINGIFEGETINTPSMLAVEDCLVSLAWVKSIGGLQGMITRAENNSGAIADWAQKSTWAELLTKEVALRSTTSVCLRIVDDVFAGLLADDQQAFAKAIGKLLDQEGAAFDIGSYKTAPAGLRIWCGGTVELSDIQALLPWLDWAFEIVKAQTQAKAA